MTLRHGAARPPAVLAPGKTIWCVAASLAAYALLAPLAVAALAGPMPLGSFGLPALAASLVGPAFVAMVAARRGLGAIAGDVAGRNGGGPLQAVLRLYVSAAMLGYVGALAALGMAVQPLVAVAVAAGLAAWLALLYSLTASDAAAGRAVALASDVALLGLFLHWGGAATAPWAAFYLVLAFDYGLRFGRVAFAAAACGSAVGFAAVAAATPVWRAMPLADLALFAALALLPLYGMVLLRRAAAGDEDAAAMRRELRAPLDALLAVSARLEPAERELVRTAVESVRAAAGEDAAPAQDFVLRDVLAGAVAMKEAEGTRLALSFSFDPRLPHLCRGAPGLLRRLLLALLDRAAAGPADVAATLAAREPEGVRLRLTVRGSAAEDDAPGRAIAASLAAALGGSVAFDGATATAELPLACDDGAAAPDLAGRTIAVVTQDRELAQRIPLAARGLGRRDAVARRHRRLARRRRVHRHHRRPRRSAWRTEPRAPSGGRGGRLRRARRGGRTGGRARRIAACRGGGGAGHRGRARRRDAERACLRGQCRRRRQGCRSSSPTTTPRAASGSRPRSSAPVTRSRSPPMAARRSPRSTGAGSTPR